jgi:hypothetical protein
MQYGYGDLVEWYRQTETEVFGKKKSHCYVMTTDPMWTRQELNPGPRSRRQATERCSLA